jgi:hypothetical protein
VWGGVFAAGVAFLLSPAALAASGLRPVAHGTAKPVRSLPHVPFPAGVRFYRPDEEIDRDEDEDAAKEHAVTRAPVDVLHAASLATLAKRRTGVQEPALTGLALGDGPRLAPPDVSIAAGAGFVVELVNITRRIWTASGVVVDANSPLAAMFTTGSDQLSDPKIQFDASRGRWFASVLDVSQGDIVAAASATSDPTGAWSRWILPGTGCADQPRLGMSDTLIVIAANEVGTCERGFARYQGGVVFALNKEQMLAGGNLDWQQFAATPRFGSPTPAQGLSAGATAFMATDYGTAVRVWALSGAPPNNVQAQSTDLPARTFVAPPDSPQPGTDTLVATNDERLLDAFWEGGKLWLSSTEACAPSGVEIKACGRIMRIATAPFRVELDSDFTQGDANVFFPAIRPDARGNVVVVYAAASPSLFPSLATVTLLAGDRWTQPEYVVSGNGPEKSGRFGDYFGAARDPNDGARVFIGGEYGSASGWATAVGRVDTGPAQLPPTVAYDAASSGNVGSAAATLAANVNAHGAATTVSFEYGETPGYGAASPEQSIAASEATQHVTFHVTGLKPETTYHFRVRAVNAGGTAYGVDQTFRTAAADTAAPVVRARPSSGRAGSLVRLRFSLADDSGEARVVDEVVRAGKVIGRSSTGFVRVGAASSVSWRAPKSAPAGRLSHCVRAFDRAGHTSGRSCASLVLR